MNVLASHVSSSITAHLHFYKPICKRCQGYYLRSNLLAFQTKPPRQLSGAATISSIGGVEQIDQNASTLRYFLSHRLFSEAPDCIIQPSRIAGPGLLREDKSPSDFERHAPKIVKMGKGTLNGRHGFPLYLDKSEDSHRSILFNVS
jgi:hypothetical protein